MSRIQRSSIRKQLRQALRRALNVLPMAWRFALYRRMIDCDPAPPANLQLKIADTREELAACFALLHDAYVGSGFMKPHPSGMRVTQYHALPTTTTLCAKIDGVVVGTMSMIREGVFGFPLQAAFDLSEVRAKEGQIAEISALAVHPDYRRTGGAILFPLMKFMYEYCTEYFDTRHLVIAVNPDKIELYESLLFFKRLRDNVVDRYDFANGAPAVGATLDLAHAPALFEQVYGGRSTRKNLFKYFVQTRLPNIQSPRRRYHTTNDPVMTPEILDHFFNQQTQGFAELDERRRLLLRSIYGLPGYDAVLPPTPPSVAGHHPLRRHQRFSLRCPAQLVLGDDAPLALTVIELSAGGFQAESKVPLPLDADGIAQVELGTRDCSTVQVRIVRNGGPSSQYGGFYGFKLEATDEVWRRCVAALEQGQTAADLMRPMPIAVATPVGPTATRLADVALG
ncbi:GNAT family N-acetyltransferase [Aquincola sp. J276]|uniref:GNAT family N-acetyltransferase n=1 Tax=Aquincola sp. J276 TaxID=2898432 RepID=UPI00215086E0|nr:GNAT family N-acetyltransferase [Aquincola sp. J276]MCR5867068.1 GNAT family N-acetyltransferase [Aquincola sp. J276]